MANLIEQAIACDDGDRAARMIQEALGIESDEVANYVFPKSWPADREQRARLQASIRDDVQLSTVVEQLEPRITSFAKQLPSGYAVTVGGSVEESAKSQ